MIRVSILRPQRDSIIFLGMITSRASIACLEKLGLSRIGHRVRITIVPTRQRWSRQFSVATIQLAKAQGRVMMIIPHLDSTTLSAPAEITTCTRVEMGPPSGAPGARYDNRRPNLKEPKSMQLKIPAYAGACEVIRFTGDTEDNNCMKLPVLWIREFDHLLTAQPGVTRK